jgi:putative hemolysin
MSLGTIVITLLVIILGEITPKIIALRYPIRVITTTKNIIKFIFITLGSITFPLHKIGLQLIKKTLKIFHQPPFPTTEEIKTFIEVSVKHGTLSSEEEDFLTNLVELSKRRASEIMTPRIKMVCLDENLNVEETLNLIYSNRLPLISRIPVYRKTIDCITGVLYLKDLLTLSTRANYERKLSEIVRPAYFVPESKPLNELLEELRKSDSHIAIVIDEYGQTAGLITLEDILETLVGEIQDEYDREDTLPYKLVGSKSYLVSGDIDLKTLDQLFEGFSSLRDKTSADRLSGFILELWGRIPKRGEILSFGDYRFEIKDIRRKRINKILITKISEETSK